MNTDFTDTLWCKKGDVGTGGDKEIFRIVAAAEGGDSE